MQIAIANTDGNVSLWCSVNSINEDGSIDFDVINGAWRGRYNNGKVFIEYTKATIPGILVWVGSRGGHYNDAIRQIQEEIDNPEYVMTQPDQYVEPVREVEEDEWDDVPF
jgi:putative aminopeptidase FrvX